MEGVGGWLLVYLIASVPVAAFYAMALAGWRLDYPKWLFTILLTLLVAPLVLVIVEAPAAREWNIAVLWAGAGTLAVRIIAGVRNAEESRLTPPRKRALTFIPIAAAAWAAAWTAYFLVSDRVANTFG